MRAVVLASFAAEAEEEISLEKGRYVEVVRQEEDGWWVVKVDGAEGIFPGSYLETLPDEPAQEQPKAVRGALPTPPGGPRGRGGAVVPRGGRGSPMRGGPARGRGGPRGGPPRGAQRARGRGGPVRAPAQRGPRVNSLIRGGRGAARGGRGGRGRPGSENRSTMVDMTSTLAEFGVKAAPLATSTSQESLESVKVAAVEKQAEAEKEASDTDEDKASKAEKEEKHRRLVVQEIITTERDYVHDLRVVSEVYINPLRASGIVNQEDLQALFSNIDVIASVNKEVMKEFEARSDEAEGTILLVGDIFLRMADFFKMYTTYCANQPQSIAALERLTAQVPDFNEFLNQCMLNEECRGLTLFSFLIKPIQRICKYPLLIRDLLKHTSEDHPDYENLCNAQVKIEAVVEYVNERKRLAENLQKILAVQKQIDSQGQDLLLVAPSRRFVREGMHTVFENGSKKERKTFVFNDLIVLTKPKKNMIGKDQKDHFKAKFFLNDIKIVDIADTDEVQNACEVLPKDSSQKYSFVFLFPSMQEKRDWVKEIKLLVREFQKKEAQARKDALAKKAAAPEEAPVDTKSVMELVDKGKMFARPKPGGRPGNTRSPMPSQRKNSLRSSSGSSPKPTRKDSKAKQKAVSKESRKAVSAALKKQQPAKKKTSTGSPLFSLKKSKSKGKDSDIFIPKQVKPKYSKELNAKLKSSGD